MTAIINGIVFSGSPEEIKKLIDLYNNNKTNNYNIIRNEEITCELIARQIEANKLKKIMKRTKL